MITWKHASDAAIDLKNLFKKELICLEQTPHQAVITVDRSKFHLCRSEYGWIFINPCPVLSEMLLRRYYREPEFFSFNLIA